MRLLVATGNANKLREIRPLFTGLPIDLLTLSDFPPVGAPDESAGTFWENARLKALGYARALAAHGPASGGSELLVVAEDSGLEIAALGGAPGVQSARFLGVDVPYPTRFAELYRRLEAVPAAAREARFVTALTAVRGDEVVFETEAGIDGAIAPHPAGEHGFGYDPIFYYAPLQKTTAQLTIEEKCIVSHRARAFRDFARWLRHTELA
jgi:XTP/dITP diphosphohydrolase